MALHGISRDAWKRYGTDGYRHWDIIAPGYKYNMFDVQAALVRSQFEKLERFHARRVALKARLDAGLRDIPEITLPGARPWVKHAYHLYPIVVRTELLTADRDVVMNAIQAENVGIGIHFRAVHLHPVLCRDVRVRAWHVPERGILFRPNHFAAALPEDDRARR